MSQPDFSILIPSIPSRLPMLTELLEAIDEQLRVEDYADRVEVIVLTDNKVRTIGKKRDDLKNLATGKYFAFVDDDDSISADYVASILEHTNTGVDVITYDSLAIVNKKKAIINMSLHNPVNEPFKPGEVIKRPPWHVCAWLSEKAQRCKFDTESSYGEDWVFCKWALLSTFTEVHIDKILHTYTFDEQISEADNG